MRSKILEKDLPVLIKAWHSASYASSSSLIMTVGWVALAETRVYALARTAMAYSE